MIEDSPRELSEYDLEAISNPRWSEAEHVHDWRNYVSEEVQMIWETFNQAQKEALFRQADENAGREEWD